MTSFESELAALIALWSTRGTSANDILHGLVFEIAKNGPAEKSVPQIVAEILADDRLVHE